MDVERCIIREARDEDFARIAALYRAFLEETVWSDPSVTPNPRLNIEHVVRRMLRTRNSAVLAAESDADAVGFAYVEFRPGTDRPRGPWERISEFLTRGPVTVPILFPAHGYLVHLFVAKPYRRKGIAAALVRASAEWVKRRGGRTLDLNVLAENEPARAFYRKLGMSELLVHYRLRL